jgi:hypothetical protein
MINRFARLSSDADGQERVLTGLRVKIAKRVRLLCTHMSDLEFDAMVDSMTRVQLKYDTLTV